jgi:glutaminyl-peptide cyclotransferase
MKAISLVSVFLFALLACGKADTKPWEEFSGEKALAHVQHLVDLGPRPSGSDALEKSRDYISAQLESFGWKVTRQQFTDETPRGKVAFVNLIARFGEPSAEPKSLFLLCSHYDTKVFETFRFVGANDGGSSAGALLEMARILSRHRDLAAKIEIVFFDGEEAVENFSETDGIYGSRHFASDLVANKQTKRFRGGVLLDMIGDRSLKVTLPPNSPVDLTRQMFASADALKLRNYFTYFDRDIIDDHTPLNAAGIPTVDLIDFRFSYWHTADDTMEKISADSLQKVGSVTAYFISEFALK